MRTPCLAGRHRTLAVAWSRSLLSVTYARNMFGNPVASSIVSFDALNLFEATSEVQSDDSSNKATDGSAKNEATNLPRSETKVRDAVLTYGLRWGTIRPDSPAASLGHPAGRRESKEHRQADPSRPRATTSPRRHRSYRNGADGLARSQVRGQGRRRNRDRTDGFKGGHSRIEEGALR